MKTAHVVGGLTVVMALGLVASVVAQEAAAPAKEAGAAVTACPAMSSAMKAQTICPITGKAISKDAFVDVDGVRIYLCCPACADKVKADPKAALAKIKANGEQCECVCVVCPKCGEFQGSDKCCKSGAVKCEKCNLDKNSPGCCKPDTLGKAMPCGMDASKCGMDASKCGMPAAPAAAPSAP